MFDLGVLELFICAVIALLVLGPERLPGAARAAGHWIGKARRMTRDFSDELDSQVKAEEIRERLRQEKSDIGLDGIEQNVREALDEAKDHEHLVVDDERADTSKRASTETDSEDQDKPSPNP